MSKTRVRARSGGHQPRAGGSPSRARAVRRPGPGPSNAFLQAKLRVGRQDDPLERAADRAADQALGGRVAESPGRAAERPQRMCAECEEEQQETVQRQAEEEEEEEELLQPKSEAGGSRAAAEATAASGSATEAAAAVRGGGRALSPAERSYFEPRFGRDFSAVRLHDGAPAQRAAAAINARAYTLGSSIAFAAGEYRPATSGGRRLLAHELAHVVQQTGSGPTTIRRSVAASSRCPANQHGAPADPLTEIASADAEAQKMTLGTSHLLFLESILFSDPTFGPSAVSTAYADRFGTPEAVAGGKFRNRFTGKQHDTEDEAKAAEMESLSERFEKINKRLSGSIRYRCPGNKKIKVGGCHDRCEGDFAWNCAPSSRSTMVLCEPFWTNAQMNTAQQKGANIVHEGSHLQYSLPDHKHDTVQQRGQNSECYEAMVADVYGFTAEVDDCPKVAP